MCNEYAVPKTLNRMKELVTRLGVSRSFINKMIANGEFPSPVVISASVVAWREDEILEWINSRPRSRGNYPRPSGHAHEG